MTTSEGHVRVGDVLMAQHPVLATTLLVALIAGGAVALAVGIAGCFGEPAPLMWRALWAGGGLALAAAVGLIGLILATLFPWVGLGLLALIGVGVWMGLSARRHRPTYSEKSDV